MTLPATLVTDGPSDRVIEPILRWLMRQLTTTEFEIRWADLRGLSRKPSNLAEKLAVAIQEYPCRLLFVHRDAEGQNPQVRYAEIDKAVDSAAGISHVGVVPVRMQEAWLLHDETALREAAGRPSGTKDLGLPPPHRWEKLPDPKRVLHEALRTANGAKGRRAKSFKPGRAAHRVADLITDWTPLRALAAFAQLEADTKAALAQLGVEATEAT